jgi:ribosomal protein S18 acetylase RimI-like enzyme
LHANPTTAPLSFPEERGGTFDLPASLWRRGIGLRAAHSQDIAWLRLLYRQLRGVEFAPMGWPEPALHAFLDQQFALQHIHYTRHYQGVDFLIIERDGQPVGRFYLQTNPPDHLLVDISLGDGARGQGIGTALIGWAQQQAQAARCGMRLHVEHGNQDALRLYRRLGFGVVEAMPTHALMRWRPEFG